MRRAAKRKTLYVIIREIRAGGPAREGTPGVICLNYPHEALRDGREAAVMKVPVRQYSGQPPRSLQLPWGMGTSRPALNENSIRAKQPTGTRKKK